MILPINRAEHCRRNIRNPAEDARQVIIAKNRRSIATARTQFVLRNLLGARRLAMSRLDLLWSESRRQRVEVQTRIRAVRLWTNRGVRIFVDATKLTFCFEIVVGIYGAGKMLRDDADLGAAARGRHFYDFLPPSKVRRQRCVGDGRTQ